MIIIIYLQVQALEDAYNVRSQNFTQSSNKLTYNELNTCTSDQRGLGHRTQRLSDLSHSILLALSSLRTTSIFHQGWFCAVPKSYL